MEFFVLAVVILIALVAVYGNSRRADGKTADSTSAQAPAPATDSPLRETVHLRAALKFTQQQHTELTRAKLEQQAWHWEFGETKLADIDGMTGISFENFLAGIFSAQGYTVETTATSGDFGADLILVRGETRIAVQAKRWKDMVGVAAVQEALAGRSYYRCNAAWVIASARFTQQARTLAKQTDVQLIDRNALAELIGKAEGKTPRA